MRLPLVNYLLNRKDDNRTCNKVKDEVGSYTRLLE